MKKGLSVWIFSKVVMLIFLFVIFGVVISFMKVVNERANADAAESLALQVRGSIQTSLTTTTLTSNMFVPLPRTLPESGTETIAAGQESKLKPYTLHILQSDVGTDKLISIGVAWGKFSEANPPEYYAAAASFITGHDIPEIIVNSEDHRYFRVQKTLAGITLCGCVSMDECPSSDPDVPDICAP